MSSEPKFSATVSASAASREPVANRFSDWEHLERLASLGTLSASISHELKNALVAVKTLLSLLIEKHPEAELALLTKKELNRMERLVSQLLGLAAASNHAATELNIHDTVESALVLISSQAKERGITLHSNLSAAKPVIKGDPSQMLQAFLNLLLNAIEAIGHHGKVIVKTENQCLPGADTEQIEVTIQDSGPGIPAEHSARIFEEFFTTKPDGTGLGLPITRRIVQEHGGRLEYTSPPGQGTTFHVRLPVLKT